MYNLPVNGNGLGIRSAMKLAPSAFLAFAASRLLLQNLILQSRTASVPDIEVHDASSSWTILSGVPEPPDERWHIQKVWDRPVINNQVAEIRRLIKPRSCQHRFLTPAIGLFPHL